MPPASRLPVAGWVLYDLANTIFSMGVVSLYFPLWIRDQVGAARADALYGTVTAVSMGAIFVASPLFGSITDRARKRMPFLAGATAACVILTALLARWGFGATIFFFILANIAFQAALQVYDSLLATVSTGKNRGTVGGTGIAFGYLGSYLAVGLGLLLGTEDKALLFLLIAASFLLFALPCFLLVRETENPRPRPVGLSMAAESTRETLRTLRDTARYPGLVRFLIGRVFYTDAINTVIAVMALYTVNVAAAQGLSDPEAQRAANWILMAAVTFAVAGGFLWGRATDRWGAKRTLLAVVRVWLAILAFAALVGFLRLPLPWLFAVASLAGFALGGVWAADRPLMLALSPPERIGEFYGLYGMVGRFSAITGPAVWAGTTYLGTRAFDLEPLSSQGFAILILAALVAASYAILRKL